jgi:hypothetical protein
VEEKFYCSFIEGEVLKVSSFESLEAIVFSYVVSLLLIAKRSSLYTYHWSTEPDLYLPISLSVMLIFFLTLIFESSWILSMAS